MNPARRSAPLRHSLSASRGALRHVISLPISPPQKLVREGGALLKYSFLSKQTHGGPGSSPWADSVRFCPL
jgi:hypothetical protein